jgi:uncharacterized protein (TIGR03083 family)
VATDVTDVSVWLDALAGSHDRLCDLVGELGDDALRGKSYCGEWTITQVLSHLGSGAEILGGTVDAAVAGEEPPSRETYPEIWARWNAMGPREVTEAALSTDGELIEKLERLGDGLEDLEFSMFGGAMRTNAVGLLRIRLGEHALHTWDVAVALDPHALVDHDAVTLLVDRLVQVTAFLGKADRADVARPFTVRVGTSDPDREFDLEVDDTVTMTPVYGAPAPGTSRENVGSAAPAVLHLPAEAFLRLLYGRLDPSHAPAVGAEEQTTLDTLRKIFPGI